MSDFNPWLVAVAGIAGIIAIVRLAVVLFGVVAERAIGAPHRAAEVIVNTGKVPPAWAKAARRKRFGADQAAGDEQAKTEVLARLDNLITHFTTSPLVADEETRQILLNELQQARQTWKERPWHEIT